MDELCMLWKYIICSEIFYHLLIILNEKCLLTDILNLVTQSSLSWPYFDESMTILCPVQTVYFLSNTLENVLVSKKILSKKWRHEKRDTSLCSIKRRWSQHKIKRLMNILSMNFFESKLIHFFYLFLNSEDARVDFKSIICFAIDCICS